MQNDTKVELARLDERLKALTTLMLELFAARDVAVRLQAEKYEARLEDLNHVNERMAVDRGTFVTDDKFQGYVRETNLWRDQVRNTLAELTGRTTGAKTMLGTLAAIVALLISIITFFSKHT